MAAVDPKELVKANAPLFAAYGAALVPIALFFTLVSGEHARFDGLSRQVQQKKTQINDLLGRLPSEDNPVFTQDHVQKFQERQELYSGETRQLRAVLRERDALLERWFEALLPGPPEPNDFITHWRERQIPALIADLGDLVRNDAGGPPGGGGTFVWDDTPPRDQLMAFQKRFWIQKAILEALRRGGATRLLARFDFPAPPAAPPSGSDVQPPYTLIPSRVVFSCSFRALPAVVRELLAIPLTTRVTRLEVEKLEFEVRHDQARLSVPRSRVYRPELYTGELDAASQFLGEDRLEEYLPEPPVKVTLGIETYDFNIPPEPAPADGAGAGGTPGEGG